MLIAGELLEKILFREAFAVFLLRPELLRNGKVRHDGCMVYGVLLNLVKYLHRVSQCFRLILKEAIHLLRGLEPLLLGITHQVGIIRSTARRETYQQFMGIGILLIKEMHVIGADHLDAVLL